LGLGLGYISLGHVVRDRFLDWISCWILGSLAPKGWRAAMPQVKARMAELAAPVQQKAEQAVMATIETAMIKLSKRSYS
jgi:hypothetical protein